MSEYRDSPALVERLARLEDENASLRKTAEEIDGLRKEVASLRAQLARPIRGLELYALLVAAVLAAGILVGFSIARK